MNDINDEYIGILAHCLTTLIEEIRINNLALGYQCPPVDKILSTMVEQTIERWFLLEPEKRMELTNLIKNAMNSSVTAYHSENN